ncbi:MAG TPA: hypothetical protein VK957_05120 [Lunatimonas sp.]|nr:hypothetical protein [Lunatimonas sp.]
MKFLAVCVLSLGLTTSIFAQTERFDRLGFGIGPAKVYGDNTGRHREFKFEIYPVATIDYSKKITPFIDLKATIGWQIISGGRFISDPIRNTFAEANLPYGFKGSLFFGDIMPIYHFNPDQSGYIPSTIKVYSGIGLGYFYSNRTDKKRIITDSGYINESYSASDSHMYIPYRLGIFKTTKDTSREIGLEATFLISPFGEIEGNDYKNRVINSDIAMQFQFYYRISLSNY